MPAERPVFRNPALALTTKPHSSKSRASGSRKINAVRQARLETCRAGALQDLDNIIAKFQDRTQFAGRLLLWLSMNRDAGAPSHTPTEVCRVRECKIAAPWRGGYLIEVSLKGAKNLRNRIKRLPSKLATIDVSNINEISFFGDAMHADFRENQTFWTSCFSDDNGKRKVRVWPSPFQSPTSKSALVEYLTKDSSKISAFQPEPETLTPPISSTRPSSTLPDNQLTVSVSTDEAFADLLLTGSIGRWEPVAPLTGVSPGFAAEPDELPLGIEHAPTVGVVDGGYHARFYRPAISWESEKLVSDSDADRRHGNVVTGLTVDATSWSNQLLIRKR